MTPEKTLNARVREAAVQIPGVSVMDHAAVQYSADRSTAYVNATVEIKVADLGFIWLNGVPTRIDAAEPDGLPSDPASLHAALESAGTIMGAALSAAREHIRHNVVGLIVICSVCRLQKAPVGRSAPFVGLCCEQMCAGYHMEPHVGSLWPGESEAEFGYPVADIGVEIR